MYLAALDWTVVLIQYFVFRCIKNAIYDHPLLKWFEFKKDFLVEFRENLLIECIKKDTI